MRVLVLIVIILSYAKVFALNPCDVALTGHGIVQRLSDRVWERRGTDIRNAILQIRVQKNLELQIASSAQALDQKLRQKFGPNLGFHYNLHGGGISSYLDKGGLFASMGDSGINGGHSTDFNQKVYFLRHSQVSIFEVLDARNPNVIFWPVRMGSILIIVDLESPILQQYRQVRAVPREGASFLDFDLDTIKQLKLFPGIPKASFVVPPISVFDGLKGKLGFGFFSRLNWGEQTYAMLQFLDYYLQDMDSDEDFNL